MTAAESLEIERKYDVGDLVRVPDLAGVGPVDHVAVDEPFTLRAVYYDTAEHLLLANRITLRRREGGHDAGWHAKLPGTDAGSRREIHVPLGHDADEPLPAELRRTIEVVLRGRPVHPVLVLTTTRTVTRLLDADGEQLAELADDEVTAAHPDTADVRSWREWEVELAEGVARTDGEALQDAVADALERAGAEVSASKSKLARGLGSSVPAPTALEPVSLGKHSAASFVVEAVTRLARELVALDPAARSGDQDAVHRFRTTIRRLRSVLRVYRGVVADDDAAWLDDALTSIGRAAGALRDLEVRSELLDHYADAAPAGFVPHETLGRLRASLGESARDAGHDLERALDDPTYFELLDRLETLPTAEPLGDDADDDRDEFVRDSLLREAKRARKRVRAASGVGAATGDEGAAASRRATLHSARKAARRLRYGLEAAKAAGVKGTGDARKTTHALQDALGDALDADDLGAWVVASTETARWAEEDTFGYGVLAMVAAADHRDSLRDLRRLSKRL